MSIPHRLAALAIAAVALTPAPGNALEDYVRAASAGLTELGLCGPDSDLLKSGACKSYDFDTLTKRIEKSLQAALAKASANVKPLLKRDQAWFNEMMLSASETVFDYGDDERKQGFVERLRRRATLLDGIAQGFGRTGIAGRWVGVFGSVTATPIEGGYRLAIDTSAAYGAGFMPQRDCKMTADVKSSSGPWLSGIALPDQDAPAKAASDKSEPSKPPIVRLRRQGETLRVVVDYDDWNDDERPNCTTPEQITANYFADGRRRDRQGGCEFRRADLRLHAAFLGDRRGDLRRPGSCRQRPAAESRLEGAAAASG